MKNKQNPNTWKMADGSVRLKKKFFDKNLRGKHSRTFSAQPNFQYPLHQHDSTKLQEVNQEK